MALESKPNGAPEAALRTETALGIKSRMISEDTGMMVMGFDIFFMFYSTIFLVLCYMDTHLTTRLVASRYGMSTCKMPRTAVLHIALDAPGARDGVSVLNWYLFMQDNEGQVVSKVKCVIMSRRQTIQHHKLRSSLHRLHTVPHHTYQHNF